MAAPARHFQRSTFSFYSRSLALAAMFAMTSCNSALAAKTRAPETADKQQLVESNLQPSVHITGTKWVQTLAQRMKYYNVPGVSIALIKDGKIIWAKGYGVTRSGSDDAVTADTIFEAASISKPVTALATMLLAQKGDIDIDESINKYLTSWHVPPSIYGTRFASPRRIMSHCAGFNIDSVKGYTQDEAKPTLLQVLEGKPPSTMPAVEVIQKPGNSFRYSAGGYMVLQQALIDLSKKDFNQFIDQTVFQPLQMTHSTFIQPAFNDETKTLAHGHKFDGSPSALRSYDPVLAPAGLRTTPSDLCNIIIEMQNALVEHGQLLKAKTARQIITTQDSRDFAALGFFCGGKDRSRRFKIEGWNYGFTCRLIGFVNKHDGAVVMTNSDNGALMFEIVESIARTYNWPMEPLSIDTAIPITAKDVKNFCGNYAWEEGAEARVKALGKRLFIEVTYADKSKMSPFPPAEIYCRKNGQYFSIFPPMSVQFNGDKRRPAVSFSYKLNDKVTTAQRLP